MEGRVTGRGERADNLRAAMREALLEMFRGLDDEAAARRRDELSGQLDRVLTHAPMLGPAVQGMSGRADFAALYTEVLRELTGSVGLPWSAVQDKN
jgi:hypothetical protein